MWLLPDVQPLVPRANWRHIISSWNFVQTGDIFNNISDPRANWRHINYYERNRCKLETWKSFQKKSVDLQNSQFQNLVKMVKIVLNPLPNFSTLCYFSLIKCVNVTIDDKVDLTYFCVTLISWEMLTNWEWLVTFQKGLGEKV